MTAAAPITLTTGRFERFSRIEWWDQQRLREAKILIVGAGALGNEVVKNLSLLGVGHLAVADMDLVEESNLTRSVLFRPGDEGRPKAEVICDAARALYPDLQTTALVGNVLGDIGFGWFRWADLVVGALDNREARVFVNSACAMLGCAWIDGGIDVLNGIVRGFSPPETACYECTMNKTDWGIINQRRSCSLLARRAMDAGGAPTTPTTASVIGAIQAQEVVKKLHGFDYLSGSGFVFEGLTHGSFPVTYQKKEDCPWHEPPADVIDFPQLDHSSTWREVCAAAKDELGALDAIDLGREVVTTLTCPTCQTETAVFQPIHAVSEADAICSQCSIEATPDFAHSISGDSPWLDKTLGEFGLPAWEIVWGATRRCGAGNGIGKGAVVPLSRKQKRNTANKKEDPLTSDDKSSQPDSQQTIATFSRDFPFQDASGETLRIAIQGDAYAEMIAHAKEFLDEEICGVLVGTIHEDREGPWVLAEGAIRGTAAKQGGKHVTYTQQTWEKIYQVKDRDFPQSSIVGWYHTHPGFGVEFSDMDLFIQQNFFSSPAQFAFVVDPLKGEEAICANTSHGLQNIGQYWVDGRTQKCWTPKRHSQDNSGGESLGVSSDIDARLEAVEQRLSELVQLSDEERNRHHGLVMTVGLLFGIAAMLWICSSIYRGVIMPFPEPPKMQSWVPVPVNIDGKTVLLGVSVNKWEVPPELNAVLVEVERQRQAKEKGETPAVPASDSEDEPKENAWMAALPMIILFGIVIFGFALAIGTTLFRGLQRGAKQRK